MAPASVVAAIAWPTRSVDDPVAVPEGGPKLGRENEQVSAHPLADPHAVIAAENAAEEATDAAASAVAILVDPPSDLGIERAALAEMVVIVPAVAAAVGEANILPQVTEPKLEIAAFRLGQAVSAILGLEPGELPRLGAKGPSLGAADHSGTNPGIDPGVKLGDPVLDSDRAAGIDVDLRNRRYREGQSGNRAHRK